MVSDKILMLIGKIQAFRITRIMLNLGFIKNRIINDISYYERNGSFSGGGYFKIFEENFMTSLF
jgi:hypothetical protein